MKSRSLGACLATLATSVFVLAGFGSALGVGSAAAQANPAGSPGGSGLGCGCEPAFTIEKPQEIAGSKSGFTASPLTGAIGQTVEYQITVTNTGNEAFVTLSLSDPRCDEGTIAGGPGGAPLAPGGSTTYSCSRLLSSAGSYANDATVTAISADGDSLEHTSNRVEVVVPPASVSASSNPPSSQPVVNVPLQEVLPCKASQPAFHGPAGPERGVFTVRVSSAGIRQITFYLDGHKLKTLKQAQAKSGKFAIKIDPRKLSHGAHTLSIKGISTDPKCGSIARSSVFVRPFTASRAVKFTG